MRTATLLTAALAAISGVAANKRLLVTFTHYNSWGAEAGEYTSNKQVWVYDGDGSPNCDDMGLSASGNPPGAYDIHDVSRSSDYPECAWDCLGNLWWPQHLYADVDGNGLDFWKTGGGDDGDATEGVTFDIYRAGQGQYLGHCWYNQNYNGNACNAGFATWSSWTSMLECDANF